MTALLLAGAMLLALAGCGGDRKENTAPSIEGVTDQMVQAGGEFDALAGVTATDAEDGDLTGKITVTSLPELSFSNGKVTPENPGDYELTYAVQDKGGLTAEAYAHLLAVDEDAAEWSTFGGAYNLPIGNQIAPLELDFTAPGEGSAALTLNLGKITPNPDDPDDTTPQRLHRHHRQDRDL